MPLTQLADGHVLETNGFLKPRGEEHPPRIGFRIRRGTLVIAEFATLSDTVTFINTTNLTP